MLPIKRNNYSRLFNVSDPESTTVREEDTEWREEGTKEKGGEQ
jgi:hypothetical protein